MLDLFAKTGSLCLLKTLTDGLEWCGLLWCFYQLFGLSFWRHPFTAEHSLVSKWWNATFLQICSHEETNWSWPILKCITCDGGNWWTGRSGCSPHVSVLQVPADVEKCQDRVECFNADLKADWDPLGEQQKDRTSDSCWRAWPTKTSSTTRRSDSILHLD